MKLRTLTTSIRRIIIPLSVMWLSPICYAADNPDAGMAAERHASVVLLKAKSQRNSGGSLEGWYKLKTEEFIGKFNKAMEAHPDTSLVVFPEYSLYRYGHTFRIDQAYDSAVNLDLAADGYYVIDPEDSYEPLVNAINAIQDLAKQHRVNVVLNTVPQKVYPDRTRFASLPQSMVTNSALIISSDGRIKDVDMKVSDSFDSNDSPQTEFAMESKKLRYFKTKDGHTISYINLICAEKYNWELRQKLAGLNADIITYGEYEGDGIAPHSSVEIHGIVQSGGYWLSTDSAKGRAGVLGFDGAKTLLSNKQDTDYVYADIPIQDTPVFGERAKTTLTHEEKTIKMKRRYNNPVVIANLPTRNGRQSAVVYVSDVQSDQFTIQLVESPELDGKHTEEEVSYLVLESGVWRFPSGQVIQVGTMEIDEAVNNGLGKDSTWANGDLILADFSHDSRVVFTQVQGEKNSSEYISTREMRPTDDSYWNYYLALERAEGVNEKAGKRNVGYVIASQGQSGKDIGQALQIGLTEKEISSHPSAISLAADLFQSTPHVFANIASYAGSDSAHLRQISSASDSNELYLMVEEDGHNDSEMRHAAERVSYLAIEGDGLLRLRDDLAENKQSNGSMEGSIANDPLMSLQAAADRQDKTATANNEDTTPDSFHFLDLKNIPQGINVQNGITVSGINTRAPISVKGGKYSINGGSQTKTQGWVENGDRVHAHHTTSREGGKTVSTVVTIGGVSSAFKTTTKETQNKLPVSRAGEDQSVTQGTRVTLNGSGSSDNDGRIKRYVWKEGTKTLSTHKKFSKVFDVGTHNITLKVIDDKGAKSRDKVRIKVKPKDMIKPAINLNGSNAVTLTVGDTYKELGAEATDNADGIINVRITSNVDTDKVGRYSVKYTAKDKAGNSASVTRIVIVKTKKIVSTEEITNKPPVAQAGPDQTVLAKEHTYNQAFIRLDGSGSSDSDGYIKRYQWEKLVKNGDWWQTRSSDANYGVFLGIGVHEFKLTVTDEKGAEASDRVRVTVKANFRKTNKPPVARAGADQTVMAGTEFKLDGSDSHDEDGRIDRYSWQQTQRRHPTGNNSAYARSTIYEAGVYEYTLTVTDENGATASDTVTVTVKPDFMPTTVSPDNISIPSKTGVDRGKLIVSDAITISGLDEGIKAFVMATNGQYNLDGHTKSSPVGFERTYEQCRSDQDFVRIEVTGGSQACIREAWSSDPVNSYSYATNGTKMRVRVRSSDLPNTTTSITVKVGAASATFSVTTK